MGVTEECADTEYKVLPDFEEEGLDESFRKSTRISSSNDEKLSAELKSSVLQTSTKIEQQANPEVAKVLEELGLRLVEDDYVKWRPDASAHPRNWTSSRKAFDTGLVLLLDLLTWVTQSRPLWLNAKFPQDRR
jgi:hypothetical protein